MQRYKVTVAPPGAETFQLLVPLSPTSTVSTLAAEVRKRITRLDIWPDVADIILHLNQADGPILDQDDLLSDVLPDPDAETVIATSRMSKVTEAQPSPIEITPDLISPIPAEHESFRVHVITPALARSHKDTKSISAIPGENITGDTTLRGLRKLICQHLEIPIPDETLVKDGGECNCSFARMIDNRQLVNHESLEDSSKKSALKFVAVYGRNNLVFLETEVANSSTMLLDAVQVKLWDEIKDKSITVVGGVFKPDSTSEYSKLPVFSICSKSRHDNAGHLLFDEGANEVEKPRTKSKLFFLSPKRKVLDLHTSEAPIEISSENMDLTINQMGLADSAINGVLTIYAVERKVSGDEDPETIGMDAIFKVGPAWEHPIPQSERGVAMLLSTLRVFTELVSARHMEPPSQDAILHVFYLLTRFPPAIRAMYILMNGKSLRACETAALAQAIYEVVKDVVPAQLIKSENGRIFEGSRLLMGLILDKAQHLKLLESVRSPYISSMNVLDLRNTFTMEPIVNPIQTCFGLVEKGYFEASQPDGLLYQKDNDLTLSALPLDARTRRLALLCGGLISEVTIFDIDSLNPGSRYADGGDVERVIAARELADIHHLAVLCGRNKLGVLPPSTLPSAEAPALTLDREGLLAVYVGRPPCAEPGKDISIFRPIRGGEESVDVSIITQLIIPILEQRDADGTAVFDSFGDQERKYRAPDELIMLCVDCSASMGDASDFVEIKDDDGDSLDSDEDPDYQRDSVEQDFNGTYPDATLDEMKNFIMEHESFTDMLCIVRYTMDHYRRPVAEKVLEILSGLASQELSEHLSNLGNLRERATTARYRSRATDCEAVIKKSKTLIDGLSRHKQAICDFLIYRAANSPVLDVVLTWKTGDAIPKVSKAVSEPPSNSLSEEEFSTPPEFLCPISQDLLEDPVITCDGFTFERRAIERWFQIRQSSPLTGLALENTSLKFNGKLSNDIKNWVEASDILPSGQSGTSGSSQPRRLSISALSNQPMNVQFFSRLGSFNRRLLKTHSVNDLYKIAFRGMKGQHPKFELHSKNVYLPPSTNPIKSTSVRSGSIIHINIPEEPVANSSTNRDNKKTDATEFEELCLIKVYNSYDHVLFSYWTPRTTTKTLGSIIFQYWRFKFKNGPWHSPGDLIVWTGLHNNGDNHVTGNTNHHWTALSKFLDRHNAIGRLKDEKVYYEESDDLGHLLQETSAADELVSPPLVLKVYVSTKPKKSSGNSHSRPGRNLSRLDVLKQMFDAFINRLLAYNFKAHIGLITFQSDVRVTQSITHAIENFRHEINNMEGRGDTALWDAIALANDQLAEYGQKFPAAKKRIICLSDGQDTKSKKRSHDVSWTLMESKVVLDSFCLGGEDNVDLRTISYLSGGYKFKPTSLEQAMAICEMEPVLSQLERPVIAPPNNAYAHSYDKLLRFVWAKDKAIPETVTRDIFPKRKQHPNINDRFVELANMVKMVPATSSGESSAARPSNAPRADTNIRTARILTEIRNILANPHPHYDVYVSESNMAFWKIVMQGPPQSAFTEGVFVLYLDMEENYPSFPPKGRFSTPIYHPNINRHGRICHSIFDRNWTSDTTILQVLNAVYSLLLVPEFSDPINAVVTLDFHWDEVAFQNEAKEHIRKHALKTRAEWRAELLG